MRGGAIACQKNRGGGLNILLGNLHGVYGILEICPVCAAIVDRCQFNWPIFKSVARDRPQIGV